MAILESAAFWIIVAAASELIALSPLKDNSIIQLVLHALNSVKGKKNWATYLLMASGCLGLALLAIGTSLIVPSKSASSTQPCLISWTTLKKSGLLLSR